MTGRHDDPTHDAVPGLDWWLDDPELWTLLEFEAGHDEHNQPIDLTWKERQQVLEDLIRGLDPADLHFARFLLTQETHSHGHSWGFRRGIEIAAILVAEHHQVQDVWLLWEAVYRSFDTWGIMPHQLLYAAGVEHTLRYATDSDHPQRDLLLEDLRKIPDVTDEHVEQLIAERRRYYTKALEALDDPTAAAPSQADDRTGRP
ncbi:hypothetical protein AB0J63_33390 [Streptosporangium canum]|uniref:hypothetical protein n=1 Tax=Streptosporangium canum TaxID=324952 RepID=UPI0034344E9A